MSKVTIAKVVVVRDETDDYIARAYDADGKRLPDCDCYTDDKEDAFCTAEAMCADYVRPGKGVRIRRVVSGEMV